MIRFILLRLTSLLASAFVASLVIFFVVEVIPGDPAQIMLGIDAPAEAVAALRADLGLDVSKPERYVNWITGLLQGDFGVSRINRRPVAEIIEQRLWISLPLALYALILSTVIAFPVALYAAGRRGTFGDAAVMGATQLGVAVPNFWFAMFLSLIFAVELGWLPSGGFPGWNKGFWTGIEALTLPAIALALPQAAILARVLRSALIDMLGEDCIRTARAKGLSRGQALRRHALRNALIPALTIMGLQFSFLIAGVIVIEKVFFINGVGSRIFQAISDRDLVIVESIVMLLVFLVILVNFAVDLAYALVDPRLRRRR